MYELFQMIWHRSVDGYRWQSGRFIPMMGAESCEGPALLAMGETLEPGLLKRFRPGDVVLPARIYLQEIVNKRLAKFVAPRLLWSLPDRNKMGLYIVPDTLIGCLWIQLAMAIAEFRKFRICEGCK